MKNSNLKNKLKLWLLSHPELNPYKFSLKKSYQTLTSNLRVLPNFIIIGAGRAGTTSLYNYLIQHPSIFPASTKNNENIADLHFFEHMISDKTSWYKSHFPTIFTKKFFESKTKKKFLTGEYTSTYMYNDNVPKRIFELIPNVKLIVILRNPVEKVYSTYSQQFAFHEYTTSFEKTIKSEFKRIELLKKYPELNAKDPDFANHVMHNLVRHGIYFDYLKYWFEIFPKKQFFIVDSEKLKNTTQETLDQVFKFLDLQPFQIPNLSKINVGQYSAMDNSSKKLLTDFYTPHNLKLYDLLGKTFSW